MPSLICLSPALLDQTFPRDKNELSIVLVALGEVQSRLEAGEIILINTDVFADFVEEKTIAWQNPVGYPAIQEIYRLLALFYLQSPQNVIRVDVSSVENYSLHLIPSKCDKSQGLIEFWAEEMGKLLVIHDAVQTDKFFLGVACAYGFGGEAVDGYDNPENRRAFPLVGNEQLDTLDDVYEWTFPKQWRTHRVTPIDIERNCRVIGVIENEPPNKDSHRKLRFKNGGSNSYSINVSPLDSDFFNQLAHPKKANLPADVIEYALLHGELPKKQLKIHSYIARFA